MKKFIMTSIVIGATGTIICKRFVNLLKIAWDKALTKRINESFENGKLIEKDDHIYYVLK